jgi:hypothetical protein
MERLDGSAIMYTQKNFGTRRSIFVCCTEELISRSCIFESSPCGSRPDSLVPGKYLFVTAPIASFWGGGGEGGFRLLKFEIFKFSLSHIKIKKTIDETDRLV